VPLNIAEGSGSASNTEFGRFLSYAYRFLKEGVTALELCQRLFPSLPRDRTEPLFDEGNQISRMIYNLMRKLNPGDDPRWASDSKLITQNSKLQGLVPRQIPQASREL